MSNDGGAADTTCIHEEREAQKPPPPLHSRETLRERERTSRQRRTVKIAQMKQQIAALECAVSTLRIVSDPDAIWDEFLDADAKRVRDYLRQSTQLVQQTTHLQLEQGQLQRQRDDYDAAKRSMTKLLQQASADDWSWSVKRWRAITRLHFQPWKLDDCHTEIAAALREMHAFTDSHDQSSTTTFQSTGLSFLGWRDQRRIDPRSNAMQFSLYKSFYSHNLRHHIATYWEIYTDPVIYTRVILGNRAMGTLDVLQRLAPWIWIVRYVERYPEIHIDAHVLYLLFRVETSNGFTQCLRSIRSPDLQHATDNKCDVWTSNFFWLRWELLAGKNKDQEDKDLTRTDYKVSIGGSLASEDTKYATRWLCEVLAAAVRAEHLATDRSLLTAT